MRTDVQIGHHMAQDSPLGLEKTSAEGPIGYRNVLGGIIRDYYRAAA
jgi:hypothetical protein